MFIIWYSFYITNVYFIYYLLFLLLLLFKYSKLIIYLIRANIYKFGGETLNDYNTNFFCITKLYLYTEIIFMNLRDLFIIVTLMKLKVE